MCIHYLPTVDSTQFVAAFCLWRAEQPHVWMYNSPVGSHFPFSHVHQPSGIMGSWGQWQTLPISAQGCCAIFRDAGSPADHGTSAPRESVSPSHPPPFSWFLTACLGERRDFVKTSWCLFPEVQRSTGIYRGGRVCLLTPRERKDTVGHPTQGLWGHV